MLLLTIIAIITLLSRNSTGELTSDHSPDSEPGSCEQGCETETSSETHDQIPGDS